MLFIDYSNQHQESHQMPHDDLVTIFTGFVRPLAEYAAPVWPCSLTVNE